MPKLVSDFPDDVEPVQSRFPSGRATKGPHARLAAGLFDDRVEAVPYQSLTHGIGFLAGGERTHLDVQEFVVLVAADRDRVSPAFEGGNQQIGVFLVGYGCDLHDGLERRS